MVKSWARRKAASEKDRCEKITKTRYVNGKMEKQEYERDGREKMVGRGEKKNPAEE